jgi:predicted TIM-barrel fold metal-dependent hydrolase
MIIDIHTHFWKPEELGPEVHRDLKQARIPFDKMLMTSESHLEATAAVDRAVVFGMRALLSGMNVSNDTAKEQANKAPDRLVFFTSVDPAETGFMEELERTHQDLGAKGIKLGPIYQGVHPTDDRYRLIYSYAQKHNLPILIHMATTFSRGAPLDYANPIHMDEIAIDFPELKIVLAHLGHPWVGECIAVIRRNRNVYADISALYYRPWQFYNSMKLLIEYGTAHKVFFGSDFPFTLPGESVTNVRNLNHIVKKTGLPPIPADVIEDIINRDSFGILGIQ